MASCPEVRSMWNRLFNMRRLTKLCLWVCFKMFSHLLLWPFNNVLCSSVCMYIRTSTELVLIRVNRAWAWTWAWSMATASAMFCLTCVADCQKMHNDSRGNVFHVFTISYTVWSVICSPNMVWLAAGLFATIQHMAFQFLSLSCCRHKCQSQLQLMGIFYIAICCKPSYLYVNTTSYFVNSECKYYSAGTH